jgi:hypothetical protein
MGKHSLKDLLKNLKQEKLKEVKVRRTWDINPKTKVKESKKVYNRQLTNKEIRNMLKKEDY